MHAGKWPRTDFLLYATSSCDNVKAYHTLGRRYGIPSFGMERSYFPYTPQAMEHWKNEHKRLIAFLEEKTGKKLDYDRLNETVRLSYRLTELSLEIDRLCRHVPCPMSAECFGGVLIALRLMPGTQVAVDFLTELRDELQERVNSGIGAVKEERFPGDLELLYAPFWDPSLLGFMQQKYGAVTVGEVLANSARRGQLDGSIPRIPGQPRLSDPSRPPAIASIIPRRTGPTTVVDQARRLQRRMGRSSTTTGAAAGIGLGHHRLGRA